MIWSHLQRVLVRFPLVVPLLAGFVYVVLDAMNGLFIRNYETSNTLAWAFITGAALALAGVLFPEGHPRSALGAGSSDVDIERLTVLVFQSRNSAETDGTDGARAIQETTP